MALRRNSSPMVARRMRATETRPLRSTTAANWAVPSAGEFGGEVTPTSEYFRAGTGAEIRGAGRLTAWRSENQRTQSSEYSGRSGLGMTSVYTFRLANWASTVAGMTREEGRNGTESVRLKVA